MADREIVPPRLPNKAVEPSGTSQSSWMKIANICLSLAILPTGFAAAEHYKRAAEHDKKPADGAKNVTSETLFKNVAEVVNWTANSGKQSPKDAQNGPRSLLLSAVTVTCNIQVKELPEGSKGYTIGQFNMSLVDPTKKVPVLVPVQYNPESELAANNGLFICYSAVEGGPQKAKFEGSLITVKGTTGYTPVFKATNISIAE